MHGFEKWNERFLILEDESGYLQIKIDDNNIKFTTCRNSRGHYQIVQMQFKLCNLASTIFHAMNKLLSSCEGKFTFLDLYNVAKSQARQNLTKNT